MFTKLTLEDQERVRRWRDEVGEERFKTIIGVLSSKNVGRQSEIESRMPLLCAMAEAIFSRGVTPYAAATAVTNSIEGKKASKYSAPSSLVRWLTKHWGEHGQRLLVKARAAQRPKRHVAAPRTGDIYRVASMIAAIPAVQDVLGPMWPRNGLLEKLMPGYSAAMQRANRSDNPLMLLSKPMRTLPE